MNDARQDNGYTKVFQDDGTAVLLPLADYDQFVAALLHRMDYRAAWVGTTLNGGSVWVKLDAVTCVLEVTAAMVELDRQLEVTQ